MSKKSIHPLVGKKVRVYWRDPAAVWTNYQVGYVKNSLIQLIGLEQDGLKFTGRPIWVHLNDIEMIEEGLDDVGKGFSV